MPFARPPQALLFAVAGVFAGAPAAAQQAEAAIPKVEVRAGAHDARRDDTAMKFVVGREELARYGDSGMLEVLKRIPGITVVNDTGRGAQVQMRGLGGGYTQVLVNGERTPNGFALDTLAPALVERIEVMRAASAELPAQAIGGTINIVLRRAARKSEREARLGWLLSDTFKGPSATLQLSRRGDASSYSLSAEANHESFTREATGDQDHVLRGAGADLLRRTRIPESGRINRFNLAPRADWTLDGGDTLSWQNLVNGSRFRNRARALTDTATGAPPPLPDLRTAMEADNTLLRSDLAWGHGFASGARLDLKLGLEGLHRSNLQLRSGDDSTGRLATDGQVRADTRDRGVNTTGKLARTIAAAEPGAPSGAGSHTLAFGWDGGLGRRDETRAERDAVRALAPGLEGDEDFAARVARLALYAQDEWTLTAAWSAYLGVRWEGVRTRTAGSGFAPVRLRSSVWSPVAQLLWKVPHSKGDQLRLALGRSYKAPALDSLVPRRQVWENNSPTEADYQGNPGLRPELAWGLDAAWEHYWAEGAMFSVSGAARRIDDHIGNRVGFDGQRWIQTPANVGRADIRTLELETRFPLASLVAGAPALDLNASLARNWSRVAAIPGPDNRVDQQTPLSAKLGMDLKAGRLDAGASLAYRDAALVRSAGERWTYAPARTDLETYGVWKFDARTRLRIALANLLGEDDAFEVRYLDAAGALERRRWTYPGGARLRATLEARF